MSNIEREYDQREELYTSKKAMERLFSDNHDSHTKPVTGCPECIQQGETRIDYAFEQRSKTMLWHAVEAWRKARGKG